MGFWSSIGHGIKQVGGLVSKAAPLAGLIPGVGSIAGGVIGAAGEGLQGHGIKGMLKGGAIGATAGMAGKAAAGLGLGKRILGGGAPSSSGGYNVNDPSQNIFAGEDPNAGGGWMGNAIGIGKRILGTNKQGGFDGSNLLGLAEGGLAGASAINSANASRRAGQYQTAALDQAKNRWAQGAPLREMGMRRMLNTTPPDLTSTYNDQTNAFSKPVAPPPAGAPPPLVPRRIPLPAGTLGAQAA